MYIECNEINEETLMAFCRAAKEINVRKRDKRLSQR